MSTKLKAKPANATWLAKVKVEASDPDLDYPLSAGTSHPFCDVDVSWYDEGTSKDHDPSRQPQG